MDNSGAERGKVEGERERERVNLVVAREKVVFVGIEILEPNNRV
jgi:hypothetical protein